MYVVGVMYVEFIVLCNMDPQSHITDWINIIKST